MDLDFKRNVGNIDRVIRIALGIILLSVPGFIELNTTWSWLLYILGSLSIFEGALGY